MISLIVAHDEKRAIGKDGWMPWNLPQDLAHFKRVTLNHAILMGKVTFEAMKKPLPKRHTYVATRNSDYVYAHEAVTIVHDLDSFLKQWKDKEECLYVCGGANIYEQALPYADEMWISLVYGEHEADTFFPAYNQEDFIVVSKEELQDFMIIHYRSKK